MIANSYNPSALGAIFVGMMKISLIFSLLLQRNTLLSERDLDFEGLGESDGLRMSGTDVVDDDSTAAQDGELTEVA